MFLGVILVLGLIRTYVSSEMLSAVFSGELIHDTIIGSIAGSLSAGNATVSYLIGGELLKEHISLVAVTSFIVAWITVGIIQLPAEGLMLGKRFAITRNIISFILAIFIAVLTVSDRGVKPGDRRDKFDDEDDVEE